MRYPMQPYSKQNKLRSKMLFFGFSLGSIILICIAAYVLSSAATNTQREYLIIQKDGSYSASLLRIMQETGILADGTLTDLIEKTQKKQPDGGWVRDQGKERWEIAEMSVSDRSLFFDCFLKLGLLDEVKPTRKKYKYAIIFGATAQGMRLRFAYLLNLMKEGHIDVEQIIFLVGQRLRNGTIETVDILFNQEYSLLPFSPNWIKPEKLPETETEIAQLIVEQTDLPSSIRNTISFVHAPARIQEDGTFLRPNTDDTVRAWLEQNPEKGTILCISSQPYVDRQLFVAKRLLPDWDIECAGPAIKNDDFNIAVILDSLARTVWEIGKMRASTNRLLI
jgi:hypothetical protein